MSIEAAPDRPRAEPPAAPILEVSGLSKSFPGVQALADISLSLWPARCTRWWARTGPARAR